MRSLSSLMVGLLLCVPLLQSRADEADELQSVIDKSIEAAGGLENLLKFQNQKAKQEGTYHGGGAAMPFTASFASAAPDKIRFEVEGVFTIVFDGKQGWTLAGGATLPMDEEQIKETKEQQHNSRIISLVPLVNEKEKFQLSKIEGQDVNGRQTVGVRVASEGHRDVDLFFDKDTHDLVKADHLIRSAEHGFEEVKQETIFSEFKEIAGVRMPTHVLLRRDGETYVEGKLFDIEPVDEFPEGTFAEP